MDYRFLGRSTFEFGSPWDMDWMLFVVLWVDNASMAYAIYAISIGLVS